MSLSPEADIRSDHRTSTAPTQKRTSAFVAIAAFIDSTDTSRRERRHIQVRYFVRLHPGW
jgi:hypothetical protein